MVAYLTSQLCSGWAGEKMEIYVTELYAGEAEPSQGSKGTVISAH